METPTLRFREKMDVRVIIVLFISLSSLQVFHFLEMAYRSLENGMNHLCGRVFDEREEMCFETMQI